MDNKVTYEAIFHVDAGKAVSCIGDLVNSVNDHLSKNGYDEKLKIHTPITIEVFVNRELTEEEQYKMKTVLESQMIQNMPEYDIRLVSFRRKSGNALQSVTQ